jgi:hypothetical protein
VTKKVVVAMQVAWGCGSLGPLVKRKSKSIGFRNLEGTSQQQHGFEKRDS